MSELQLLDCNLLFAGYRCGEPLVFDLIRPALEKGAAGDRARVLVKTEFERAGVIMNFTLKSHMDPKTNRESFTEWQYERLSATTVRMIIEKVKLDRFYSDVKLEAYELLWAMLSRLTVALHSPCSSDLYLPPAEFGSLAKQYAKLYQFITDSSPGAYVHDNAVHIPEYLEKYGSIFQFNTSVPELMHKVRTFRCIFRQ